MRRLLFFASGLSALALSTGASLAQSVDVEVYSPPRYSSSYYGEAYQVRPGARVYGYRAGPVTVEPQIILRPTSCGQFRYWDGSACVDARDNPPNIR
jgi:hypothetical protein